MAISVGDAVYKLTGDTKDLDKALASSEQNVKASMEKMQSAAKKLGVAFTAVGAAGLLLVDSALKMNAKLSSTGLIIGATTKEMRDLALATTNVTFPLESVVATFDYLARAGVKEQEVLKDSATAFDILGDATGSSAEVVAKQLIPAFKLFGKEIPTTAQELDDFTWLTKNTTVNLDEFGGVMSYVAQYGDDLNLSLEDMVAIMAVLESKGKSGSTATKMFRTAVTQASTGVSTLNEALGITNDEVAHFRGEMAEATGITMEYADAANRQYGIMDKVKQKWSELTLQLGSMLTPLEPLFALLTALGPLMLIFALNTTAATLATRAFGFAWKLALGPIGWAIMAIEALVIAVGYLLQKFGLLDEALGLLWRSFKATAKIITGDVIGAFNEITGRAKEAGDSTRTLAGVMESAFDKITGTVKEIGDAWKTTADDAKTAMGKAIDDINYKYGSLEEAEKAVHRTIRQLAKQTAADQLAAARQTTNDLLSEIQKRIDAEQRAHDAARSGIASDAIKELQDQIDQIDDEANWEALQRTRNERAEEEARLRKAVADADAGDDKIAAQEALDAALGRHADAMRREEDADRKRTLREQIEDIRDGKNAAVLAAQTRADKEFAIKQQALDNEKIALDAALLEEESALAIAHQATMARIEEERLAEIAKAQEAVAWTKWVIQAKAALEAFGIGATLPSTPSTGISTPALPAGTSAGSTETSLRTQPSSEQAAAQGYRTANITFEADGRVLAQIIGEPLVDEIRLRTGVNN